MRWHDLFYVPEILCSSSRVNFVLRRCFNFRFIHERMFWEELDDYPEVIRSSFLMLTKTVRARSCFIGVWFSCFEAEGDLSVISFRVGKRERVSQIEVTFFEFVFGKIMFWISLSLVGVLFNCYDNMGYYYDALVCIFSTY